MAKCKVQTQYNYANMRKGSIKVVPALPVTPLFMGGTCPQCIEGLLAMECWLSHAEADTRTLLLTQKIASFFRRWMDVTRIRESLLGRKQSAKKADIRHFYDYYCLQWQNCYTIYT